MTGHFPGLVRTGISMKSGMVKGYSGQLYRATTSYNIPLLIWG